MQRLAGDTDWTLRGRVLTRTDAHGATSRLVDNRDDLVSALRGRFGLDVPQAADLWPAICTRHEQLFGGVGGDH